MKPEQATSENQLINELLLVNMTGTVRRDTYNGRRYLVAPMVTIVPGVLSGSRGALYYPPEEVAKEPGVWNHVPLVLNHPMEGGQYVSARSPGVLEKYQLGYVFNDSWDGKRRTAEGWFDEEHTRRISPEVYEALLNNKAIELSTGLMTDNHLAANGSNYNGKSYTHVARNYRPDHLAILPKQRGACSNKDGCGVLVNEDCKCGGSCEKCKLRDETKSLLGQELVENCGGPGSGVPGPCSGLKAAPQVDATSGNPSQRAKSALGKIKEAHQLGQIGTEEQKAAASKASELSQKAIQSTGAAGKSGSRASDQEAETLHRDAAKAHRESIGFSGRGTPRGDAHYFAAKEHDMIAAEHTQRSSTRNELTDNALGKGNHSLAKRSSHAEELSKLADSATEMATDAESHKAAKEAHEAAAAAHRSAAYEAAHGMSTWAEPDFGASGMHANKAKNHDDKAIKHSQDITGNCGGPGSGVPGPCATGGGGDAKANSPNPTGKKFDSRNGIKISPDRVKAGHVISHGGQYYKATGPAVKDGKPGNLIPVEGGHIRVGKSATIDMTTNVEPITNVSKTVQQGDDMPINRAEVIANLTTNCECWKGKEKTLNSMDDSTLETVVNQQTELAQRELVVNAAREIVGDVTLNAMPAALQAAMDKKAGKAPTPAVPDEEEEELEDEEVMVKNFLKLPMEKRMLPAEMDALNFAKGLVSNAKAQLVEKIVTANASTEAGRKAIRPTFEAMDHKTLQTLAREIDAARPTNNGEQQGEVVRNQLIDYLGLGGTYTGQRQQVANVSDDDVLAPYAYQHVKVK